MPDLPTITVVTPSYNQGAYLERTIRSVLAQAYPRLQYIIMDGGSTDNSVDIIKAYASGIDFWQSRPDGGQSAAINAGWRRATGEILAWLNSDDYYLPGTLEFVGEYFATHPDVWVAYGSWEAVDPEGGHLHFAGRPFSRRLMILSQNCIPQPSSFIRRKAIMTVGYLNEDLRYVMDLDLFLRTARYQRPVFLGRTLARATFHPDAKTTRDRDKMARERYVVRRKYASPLELPLVLAQPVVSRLYHSLPAPARHLADAVRPHRTFKAPRTD